METLKTSDEWYQYEKSFDILDPDGWRSLSDPDVYWYFQLITRKEYENRFNGCTVVPYGKVNHRPPFIYPYKKEIFCCII